MDPMEAAAKYDGRQVWGDQLFDEIDLSIVPFLHQPMYFPGGLQSTTAAVPNTTAGLVGEGRCDGKPRGLGGGP